MIELYKRKVWNDEKTVNTIWSGVLHDNPKIVLASCKFFLALTYDHNDSDASDDSSELEEKINTLK
jgi:protein SDA1